MMVVALVLMVVLSPGRARAADLIVDTSTTTPYTVTGTTTSFTNENVGDPNTRGNGPGSGHH